MDWEGQIHVYTRFTGSVEEISHPCSLCSDLALVLFLFLTGSLCPKHNNHRRTAKEQAAHRQQFRDKSVMDGIILKRRFVCFVCSHFFEKCFWLLQLVWACGAKVNNSRWEAEVHHCWRWYSGERRGRREEPALMSELCGRREVFSGLLTLSVIYLKAADTARGGVQCVCVCVCVHMMPLPFKLHERRSHTVDFAVE